MSDHATQPEDVTRLVVERLNAGDGAGVAASTTRTPSSPTQPISQPSAGRPSRPSSSGWSTPGSGLPSNPPLPTVEFEDLALTSTRSADNTGVRVQLLRRQPDGCWLRIIDRPEAPTG
jgi:hypothetical protein